MTPGLIYILGAGRSGSTVIERLLASAPMVVGVGEVHVLWRLPLSRLTCSCGAPALDCGFWRHVRAEAGLGAAGLLELMVLERRAIRHWRLILEGRGGREFARFAALQRRLFSAIRDVSGATTVIDSSKAAPRAWALADFEDATFLHLRRNPRDVIGAWRRAKADPSKDKPMRRGALASGADWLRTEVSAARLAARRPVEHLRYEDFIAGPRAAIAARPNLPQDVAWTGARRFLPDPDYHALSGNPDRFSKGEIVIRPPDEPLLPSPAPSFEAVLNRTAP